MLLQLLHFQLSADGEKYRLETSIPQMKLTYKGEHFYKWNE